MGADVPVPEESSKLSKISALAPWALETSVRKRCGRASQVACLRVGSHDEGLVSLSLVRLCLCVLNNRPYIVDFHQPWTEYPEARSIYGVSENRGP